MVKWIVDKLEENGYAGVPFTIKSDQEPAMMKLKQAIAARRKAETPLIESPVRESHANGRIGTQIDNGSALVEWLFVWAADILSKYTVHENGRTSYEMATQHVVKHKAIGLAKKVHFQFKVQREKRNACSNEKKRRRMVCRHSEPKH